jgi:hypothetical protein
MGEIARAWLRAAARQGVLLLLAAVGQAFGQNVGEYPVKAAFLLNFARYTEWPAQAPMSPNQQLTLCVIGADPFGASLAPLERKNVQGREMRIQRGVTVDSLGQCELLFVPESEEPRLASILHAARGRAVLTVSDIEGFAEAGGMIGLLIAEQRVRFDVNLDALRGSNLRLSAQVLRLARTVIGARATP